MKHSEMAFTWDMKVLDIGICVVALYYGRLDHVYQYLCLSTIDHSLLVSKNNTPTRSLTSFKQHIAAIVDQLVAHSDFGNTIRMTEVSWAYTSSPTVLDESNTSIYRNSPCHLHSATYWPSMSVRTKNENK
jgi:hypothetical protein